MTLANIEKWEYEDNYSGEDYTKYYVIYSRNRDSNVLTNSNFDCVRRDIEFYHPNSTLVVSFTHWLVGWVEFLLIHESEAEALAMADDIAYKLKSIYPIYEEDDYSVRLEERAEEIWDNSSDSEKDDICKSVGCDWGGDSYPSAAIEYIIEYWEL